MFLGDQCPIATGNWGCGVFGGDPQLKSLIQWMAASQAGVPMVYYFPYGDRRVEEVVYMDQVCLSFKNIQDELQSIVS